MADHDLFVLMEMTPHLGFNLIADGVQVVGSREIVAAGQAAPFEAGLLAISPLRSLLVNYESMVTAPGGSERPWEHPHAPAVTRFLSRFLGSDDERVTVINADGVDHCPVRDVPGRYWPMFIYVSGGDEFSNGTSDPRAMHRIVARLRQPDGCPWDRKQTHQSLRKSMIDEVYEIVDAIDSGDAAHLAEELGDMVLLIVMQAQIAHEAGEFSIEDVYRGIATKIVGRHPHVFGDATVDSDADLSGIWSEAKAKEKAETGERGGKDVDGEPFSMPALERAARVLRKHPVVAGDDTPELLRLVSEIVASGDDPEAVLRQQLREHVIRDL
ncbi:MAG: MazG family protein [Chloroflexia bacterium]|nr:MazG family protein [Chloroflexia bacterium]